MTTNDARRLITTHLRASKRIPEPLLDTVTDAILDTFTVRHERLHGVLTPEGFLTPLYAYLNPFRHDPETPGWTEYDTREREARNAAHDYETVRITTGWTTAPRRTDATP